MPVREQLAPFAEWLAVISSEWPRNGHNESESAGPNNSVGALPEPGAPPRARLHALC